MVFHQACYAWGFLFGGVYGSSIFSDLVQCTEILTFLAA